MTPFGWKAEDDDAAVWAQQRERELREAAFETRPPTLLDALRKANESLARLALAMGAEI